MSSKMGKRHIMVGKWIPADRDIIAKWAKKQLEKFKKQRARQYKAMVNYFPETYSFEEEVQQFVRNAHNIDIIADEVQLLPSIKQLVLGMGTNPSIGMLMVEMFKQDGRPMTIKDFIFLLNSTIREAPVYSDDDGTQIPVPIGALLTYAMATPAGFAGFLKDDVNVIFKDILDDYGKYLSDESSDSKDVLTKDGWLSADDFTSTFVCPDTSDPHYGFKSWDAFFTRKIQPAARPIADPSNALVIANACENAPYQVSYTVGKYDAFWIKTQPYSLQYILDNDENLERFVGGTVYQGFLSPHTYHRFHAPVSGKLITVKNVPGTYFSQPYYTDSAANYIASQPYLAHMATRAVYIFDTENENVGLVAFVPIGMIDVSSVDIDSNLRVGSYVKKGDGIGTFHFGGSSHLVIFEKNVRLAFDMQGIKPDPNGNEFLNVRSRLATVVPN